MTSPGPPGRPFPPSLPPRGRGIRMETTQLDSEGFGWKVCATTQLGEECSRRLPELSIMDAGRETHPPQGWLAKHTGQNYASSGSPALPAGSQPRQEGAEAGQGPDPLPPGDVDTTGLPHGQELSILCSPFVFSY